MTLKNKNEAKIVKLLEKKISSNPLKLSIPTREF
tara:strand:+ start:518 stop:619 length:102 start_codon:yes stop_codon:yes gene_type:complete